MNQTWKTYLVVALIVGLIIGAGIGWTAKPIPPPGPEWVSKSELDKVKADLAKLTGDYNKLKADYDKLLIEIGKSPPWLNEKFFTYVFEKLDNFSTVRLTLDARLLLWYDARVAVSRRLITSSEQLEVSLFILGGVSILKAELERRVDVDALHVYSVWKDTLIPILVRRPSNDKPCFVPSCPVAISLQDLWLSRDGIIARFPELKSRHLI